MPHIAITDQSAQLVDPSAVETLDVLGPTIQFLTAPDDDSAPCVMRGTIPAGIDVPLHSHADPETFLMLEGEVEGLVASAEGFAWVPVAPSDIFHVPGGAKHAFRNRSGTAAVMNIVSTGRIGRFFREVASPPTVEHFAETAARYGHWLASPAENAEVGLTVPPSA
ncbi:MAG TPA: cupin domain-containing protein [Solirubrobacteraceae bacterium]|nr:cupin domain-containing protein [Solirubrobacteraceae bacterium]